LPTYSVHYRKDEGGTIIRAADWGWLEIEKWNRSVQWSPVGQWEREIGLDEEAYRGLLNHFGLTNWWQEFPMERINKMSPQELAKARREKERQYSLPRQLIISDTLGFRIPAEDY